MPAFRLVDGQPVPVPEEIADLAAWADWMEGSVEERELARSHVTASLIVT